MRGSLQEYDIPGEDGKVLKTVVAEKKSANTE
jgi:hypothetical protein